MNRLQLFGPSKYFSLSSKDLDISSKKEHTNISNATKRHGASLQKAHDKNRDSHLLSLPSKILTQILELLDISTLLSLCRVNCQLYEIISNKFLYQNVILDNKLSLLKFDALIHSEFHSANALLDRMDNTIMSQNIRFLVKSIEFSNPQCQDALLKYGKFHNKRNQSSVIGGAYTFDNRTGPIPADSRSSSMSRRRSDAESMVSNSSSGNHNASQDTGYASSERHKQLNKLECQYSRYTYIELMLDIIDYLPNVTHVKLTNVEPNFKIPLWYSVFNDGSRDFFKKIINGQQSINGNDLRTFEISKNFVSEYERKFYTLPRVKTLEIRANLDKRKKQQVSLRPNMLSCFGIINELILQDIIIDTESLDTPLEFVPFHLRLDAPGVYDLHSTVHLLTLKSCKIIPGNGILRLFHDYFKCVKNLKLLSFTSKYDMLLCSCFSSLTDLTVDCNSPCFLNEQLVNDNYYYNEEVSNSEVDSDSASFTETLLDEPVNITLQAPPPTTPVVLSLDLKYLARTPSNHKKGGQAYITESQGEYFNQLRIPPFHYFYHYFKDLWDRLPRRNININVVNIPFTNVFPLSPQLYCEKILRSLDDDQQTLIPNYGSNNENETSGQDTDIEESSNYWNESVRQCLQNCLQQLLDEDIDTEATSAEILDQIGVEFFNNYKNSKYFQDIPNVNLWCFLKSLSEFKSVKINMLRRWLFCTTRSRYDWELLLRPVLNVSVPIEVRDRDGIMLYSYGNQIHSKNVRSVK